MTKEARNAYMREWNKKKRFEQRESLRTKVAALAGTTEPPVKCNSCSREYARTASQRAQCSMKCARCKTIKSRTVNRKLARARKPEKWNAWQKAYKAIKRGGLVRLPCERCGCVESHAHHSDYSKPLEVSWLCRNCHETEHHRIEVAS